MNAARRRAEAVAAVVSAAIRTERPEAASGAAADALRAGRRYLGTGGLDPNPEPVRDAASYAADVPRKIRGDR